MMTGDDALRAEEIVLVADMADLLYELRGYGGMLALPYWKRSTVNDLLERYERIYADSF